MHLRRALSLFAGCWWLAMAPPAAGAPPVSVLGIDLEVSGERERLLIYADGPLAPRLVPGDERTLTIALPGAVLSSSAPTEIAPVVQGTVVRVDAFEAEVGGPHEVHVVVQRRPGDPPQLTRRGRALTVEFEARPRVGESANEPSVPIAYQNAPLVRVATELARATGQPIVYDESLALLGAITVEGPPSASRGEARMLLDTALGLHGYAAIPAPGGVAKIVRIGGDSSRWVGGEIPESDAPVTTLLRLESTNATALLPVLQPYLGATAVASVFEPTNSLILSGPAARLRRLRTAIEALDALEAGAPLVWSLQYGNAEAVAEQMREILDERDAPLVSADARTNSLLLRLRPTAIDRARRIVNRLDRPSDPHGGFYVIRIDYADPETLVEQLLALRDAPVAEDDSDQAAERAGLRGLAFDAVVDPPTHSIVLRAAPEALDAVLDVIDELDQLPTEVRVEVTIAQVDLDGRLDLGFDFFIPTLTDPDSADDLIATVSGNPSGGGVPTGPNQERPFVALFTHTPLLLPVVDPITGQMVTVPIGEQVALTLNNRAVESDTLLRPQLLLTSGEEHEIFAGDNVPIPVAESPTAAATTPTPGETGGTEPTTPSSRSSLQLRKNIERQDVGTTLRITPTVGARGGVELELTVEVSSLRDSLVGNVEEVGPTIRETLVESKIRLRHGEVAVIATLEGVTQQSSVVGTPWLKDIPILGWAFRTTRDQTVERHLLVAAQADVVRTETRALGEALSRELGPPPSADPTER